MAGRKAGHLRRLSAVLLALGCLGLVAGGSASGAVTIGQVPSNAPLSGTCQAGDYLQPSVTGGDLYIAREAGRITSWTTYSTGAGTYTFKVFRRTNDPDAFQVVARASEQTLNAGLQTFPVDIPVRSGDMIGFHRQGTGQGSCTIAALGDAVLFFSGDVPDGGSGAFSPLVDRRLNLSATLVPSNEFQITQLIQNRKRGIATMVVQVSNPGVFALSARGLKKPHVFRTLVGAGSITFRLIPTGKPKRQLRRKGTAHVRVNLTFAPTNGDPSIQTVGVNLRMKRSRAATR